MADGTDHDSRKTRSAEPYRVPTDLVSSTGDTDLDNLLNATFSSAERQVELNFKMLDGHLTNADRVIGNVAAMKNLSGDPIEVLERLASVNFTE